MEPKNYLETQATPKMYEYNHVYIEQSDVYFKEWYIKYSFNTIKSIAHFLVAIEK